MIEVQIQMQKGKMVGNNTYVKDLISSLDDGRYVLTIQPINPLISSRDYQNAYFAMVDTCVAATGNSRYVIHEAFKKESKVDSTRHFDEIRWKDYLSKFRFWAYNNMDVIV